MLLHWPERRGTTLPTEVWAHEKLHFFKAWTETLGKVLALPRFLGNFAPSGCAKLHSGKQFACAKPIADAVVHRQ
jgi:hypothetical protein